MGKMDTWGAGAHGCDMGKTDPQRERKDFRFACLDCASKDWRSLLEPRGYGTNSVEKGFYCPGLEGRVRGS